MSVFACLKKHAVTSGHTVSYRQMHRLNNLNGLKFNRLHFAGYLHTLDLAIHGVFASACKSLVDSTDTCQQLHSGNQSLEVSCQPEQDVPQNFGISFVLDGPGCQACVCSFRNLGCLLNYLLEPAAAEAQLEKDGRGEDCATDHRCRQ
jgi:hypothetical protein